MINYHFDKIDGIPKKKNIIIKTTKLDWYF